jgi:hypothetical protein
MGKIESYNQPHLQVKFTFTFAADVSVSPNCEYSMIALKRVAIISIYDITGQASSHP